MYKQKKVVVGIPSRRQRYMRLLIPQLRKSSIIDEIVLWVNTRNSDDLAWIEKQTNGLIRMHCLKSNVPDDFIENIRRVGHFICECNQPDTIYIKIDDDIVWLESDAIERLVQYRYENPEPFVVFPCLLNTSTTSYLLQQEGWYQSCPPFSRNLLCPNGWKSGEIALLIHLEILKRIVNNELNLYARPYVDFDYAQHSICTICWNGEDMTPEFYELIKNHDEYALSSAIPKTLSRPVHFMNNAAVVHYGYNTQRNHLDRTDILAKYEQLCKLQLNNN